jgi:iron complex outermembrane receptor protein
MRTCHHQLSLKVRLPLTLLLLFVALNQRLSAQSDTIKSIVLDSVVVVKEKPYFNLTSFEEITLTPQELRQSCATILCATLSQLPGLSQITTGAISRPVIRGLTADRIQINFGGIRLEDQQWEDEYGLVLTCDGLDETRIIKGPATLLYGSGAMGGVISIGNESMPEPGNKEQDLSLRMSINTLGLDLNYGFKKSGRNNFLLQAGITSHGDYSDGEGEKVPNSRYGIYHLNLGYDINREKFSSENRFRVSFNQFGFIADSADLLEEESESPFNRAFEDAHLSVFSFLGTSTNTFKPDANTEWKVELGLQTNSRQEMERSEEVEMGLLLNTVTLNASLEKAFGLGWRWTNGLSGMLQFNNNCADRIVVPDATIGEVSAFSYINKLQKGKKISRFFEAGLRYDIRRVATHPSESEEIPSGDFPVFVRNFGSLNGSIGESLTLHDLTVKLNLSSGFRSGNLAELAANGLHEGTAEWFEGDPNLKPERCLNGDLSLNWANKWFSLRGSAYRNRFFDYIYLRPTDEKVYGYKIFRYEQTDATFSGFETGITVEKEKLFSLSIDYSHLNAKHDDGSWLPFIPADRLMGEGRYYLPTFMKNITDAFLLLGAAYTWKQDHIDQAEAVTPGYLLLNTGAGFRLHYLEFNLACRNLTNKLYYDHLSKLKYYGLYDMGRNIVFGVNWKI